VVCHKDFLGNQWRDRIAEFLPTARIGTIKQNVVDVTDKDIVIASLQSIAMKDYAEHIFKDFGFAVFDEAHHLSAEVFSQCLPKTTCKRMLGLSATLKRKDGLSKVFEWYLGETLYQIKREDTDLKVIVKRYYDPNEEYSKEETMGWSGKLVVARMINNVCNFSPRNHFIIENILDIFKKEPDRQMLVLSERRNHLIELETILKQYKYTSIGYYTGGMKQEQLDMSATKQILLGTFQLAQEGMDVPTLNTLVLASPVSSIEQAIGRIQRQQKHSRKYQPLVLDIIDEFSIFERQGIKRLAFYRKNKYEIVDGVKNVPVKYTFVTDPDEA
jgi:superfamily II DNA or RNA helicase